MGKGGSEGAREREGGSEGGWNGSTDEEREVERRNKNGRERRRTRKLGLRDEQRKGGMLKEREGEWMVRWKGRKE